MGKERAREGPHFSLLIIEWGLEITLHNAAHWSGYQ